MTNAETESPSVEAPRAAKLARRIATWRGTGYLGVFAFALLVRGLYVSQVDGSVLFETIIGDGRSFDAWAQQLLSPGEKREAFYQAPLYPYFLALIYRLFGHDLLAVRMVQIVLGSLSCVLTAGAANAFFSRRAGMLAGLLLAVYPMSFYFDGLIQKTSLAQFFAALLFFLLARLTTADHWGLRSALALGAVLGAWSLLRENALALAPVCLLWLGQQAPRRQRVRFIALFLLGLGLALSPAAWRNYDATGLAFPTTYNFGTNFYIGNHAEAPGHYVPLRPGRGDAAFERQDAQDLAEKAVGRKLSGAEVSGYWTKRTLSDIRADFPGWLKRLAWKWILVWNVEEISDTDAWRAYADYSPLLSGLGALFHFGVLCPMATFGLVATWHRRRELWILYALLLTVAASVTLFFVFGRYRIPVAPVLVSLAGAGLADFRKVSRDSRPHLMACAGCAIAVALAVNWPLGHIKTDSRAVTYNSIGLILRDDGQVDRAAALFSRAIELEPDLWWAHANLAKTLRIRGDLEASLPHFRKALQGNRDPMLGGELGLALLNLGRIQAALPLLASAVEHSPQNPDLRNNLGAAHLFRGELTEARRHFRLALQLDPNNLEAKLNLETIQRMTAPTPPTIESP
jgi:tetratricopeptide (TPR) repeat protein